MKKLRPKLAQAVRPESLTPTSISLKSFCISSLLTLSHSQNIFLNTVQGVKTVSVAGMVVHT